MNAPPEDLDALTNRAGWIDRSDRHRLDVTGPDRAKFLHNLTTNDVKRLAVGRGHEAFVTSPQGKTLGYVSLLAAEDSILVRTDPGGLAGVLPHFQKYGIFDDVTMADAGPRTFEYHLAGPLAGDLLGRLGGELPPRDDLAHRATTLAGRAVRVVRESPTGFAGLTLIGDRADAAPVAAALTEAGAAPVAPATFEALRIEAGTPAFGRDVMPETLPQEVGRDARAINFVKGCYLGQETVARLDALGHVNKILRGLSLDAGPVPPPGTPLHFDGKRIGAITSAAFSPRLGRPVALAYVRVAQAAPGVTLQAMTEDGAIVATVAVDRPVMPPG